MEEETEEDWDESETKKRYIKRRPSGMAILVWLLSCAMARLRLKRRSWK